MVVIVDAITGHLRKVLRSVVKSKLPVYYVDTMLEWSQETPTAN